MIFYVNLKLYKLIFDFNLISLFLNKHHSNTIKCYLKLILTSGHISEMK